MRKINILLFTAVICFGSLTENAFGRHPLPGSGGQSNSGGNSNSTGNPSLAAGCAAANAATDLNLNNVRAIIHTGGDFWMNRSAKEAGYEIPKGSKKYSIYSGALWMGGVDVNGQLKLAAQRFRSSGNDYWSGPLNTVTVEIDDSTCAAYDKHFITFRQDIEKFNRWYEMSQDDPAGIALDPEFAGYTIPKIILEWPAHGNPAKNEDYYLAPFFDRNGDGNYNPFDGDYPGFELVKKENDCRISREVNLYGDMNLWWIFNDKGNIHTESGGAAIGMEIRGQAFAFATNDEINNMTFYNYELVNRSTFELQNTYFGVWVDPDLGRYDDDYVGCDVQRGLGYCYNGEEVDGTGGPGDYGANPPAVGVDFFEGPYQDNDGIDNPGPSNNLENLSYSVASGGNGIPYRGLGIGYGDGIVDNERFGMTRFLYHNNIGQGTNPAITDPQTASDYYNFLRGIWKDNTQMKYYGNGHTSGGGSGPNCNYMFPGVSDPVGWGTGGTIPSPQNWTEESEGNVPYDRRFAQSAGPFTLKPGAKNNITVGVVWARAVSGGPYASVRKLKSVDDKAQALFDNCFRIVNGPDAPDVTVKELDKEIILLLSNKKGSNNFNQAYEEIDFRIPEVEYTVDDTIYNDRRYKFQGYLVYQVKDANVGPDDLGNPDKARLVSQCDIKDSIVDLINFRFNEDLQVDVPEDVVIRAENKGIVHSFRVLEDKFAQGDRSLVNHKPYYFIVMAYGYNNFKKYDPMDPNFLDGQKLPYILSRKSLSGGIRAHKAIPHNPAPLNGGTKTNAKYGDMPMITRIEGEGNGGMNIEFTEASEQLLFTEGRIHFPQYKRNKGPLNVKVVDPLSVPKGDFEIKFNASVNTQNIDGATWTLTNLNELVIGNKEYAPGKFIVKSDTTIKVRNEQIITEIGMSVIIEQVKFPGADPYGGNGALTSTMEFAKDGKGWLTGVIDVDGETPENWIRSGSYSNSEIDNWDDIKDANGNWRDPKEDYERLIGGTWAPYTLVSNITHGPGAPKEIINQSSLNSLKSVDIVITNDQSKWTRCPVLENQIDPELAIGKAKKNQLRASPSVGKDGKPDNTGNGMGWFPGYAVCLETGERLNMAFSEDSWLSSDNGNDMLWNPTSTRYAEFSGGGSIADAFNRAARFGGKHFIYVFDKNIVSGSNNDIMPAYDMGDTLYKRLSNPSAGNLRSVWKSCMWVGFPLLEEDAKFLESDVRIKLRVERPYRKYETKSSKNNSIPLYSFNLDDLAVEKGNETVMDSVLTMLNVVPNPYYAYSAYEVNQLDNRIRIINLPEECSISIYTVNGTLIRQFRKADPTTSLDWDLKNHVGIPISGGVYLIHINVPNVGERVLKWFGVMRPIDLDSF